MDRGEIDTDENGMEGRGRGEGKVTQRLGDGRAGRDDHWRRMENEGRRQQKIRGKTPEKPETEIGTTEIPPKVGAGGGRRKWKSGEYVRYCREMRIDMWEGVHPSSWLAINSGNRVVIVLSHFLQFFCRARRRGAG